MSLISMYGAWLSFSDAPFLDDAELQSKRMSASAWLAVTAQANDADEDPQPRS